MEYRMGQIVDTGFLTDRDKGDENYFNNFHISGLGDYFNRYYRNRMNFNALPHHVELRTFQNMPVSFNQARNIRNTDLRFECDVDFYYDRIPQDNPTIEDWK